VNPKKAALKTHLEDLQEDGARMGIFMLKDSAATPEKICQFFSVLGSLDETRRTDVLTALAKVDVSGFDAGQYESMCAFAMTHENPDVRNGYMDILAGLSGENLLKVLQQPVYWPGLPGSRAMLGMFIISRELPTDERIRYVQILFSKLTNQLWDIKMDDGWPLIWSLLLFGDKEPEGGVVRDCVKSIWLRSKEKFEELMRHRPGGFSKANEETHGSERARNQLNDRMENMRKAMNDYLRPVAREYDVEYEDIEWTS
jgi:hypothetical protein